MARSLVSIYFDRSWIQTEVRTKTWANFGRYFRHRFNLDFLLHFIGKLAIHPQLKAVHSRTKISRLLAKWITKIVSFPVFNNNADMLLYRVNIAQTSYSNMIKNILGNFEIKPKTLTFFFKSGKFIWRSELWKPECKKCGLLKTNQVITFIHH